MSCSLRSTQPLHLHYPSTLLTLPPLSLSPPVLVRTETQLTEYEVNETEALKELNQITISKREVELVRHCQDAFLSHLC